MKIEELRFPAGEIGKAVVQICAHQANAGTGAVLCVNPKSMGSIGFSPSDHSPAISSPDAYVLSQQGGVNYLGSEIGFLGRADRAVVDPDCSMRSGICSHTTLTLMWDSKERRMSVTSLRRIVC